MAIPCIICGPSRTEEIATRARCGGFLRSVICTTCGLVYSDPRPQEDIKEYYRSEYRLDYKNTFVPKLKHIHRAGRAALDRLKLVMQFAQPGALLDAGSGGGEFLYLARRAGFQVQGIEPNSGYATYARDTYQLTVHEGFIDTVAFEPGSFDTVTLWHALEHMESPVEVIQQLGAWLRPEGRLFIEVPNVLARCQAPKNRFHRAHLYSFSPTTLLATAARAGLHALHCETSPDEGNISAVFSPSAPAREIPSDYDRVRRTILGHNNATHFLTLHPYRRPMDRAYLRMREYMAMRGHRDGRSLLDALQGQA